MSLFGTIQQSSGALQAAQIGLQVVGNNIANANTPGYIRQTLEQASAVASRDGNLIKGHGVRTLGITQSIDKALAERMIQAQTAMSGSEVLQKAFSQLEELTTDLDNTGLNRQLSLFNNALHELSSQPGDRSLRDFVIMQGETLADSMRRVRQEALARRELWNDELDQIASQVNRLIERIAKANVDIATLEGGGLIPSDAAGLRDQRLRDLEELSKYIKINVQEQESGAIAIFVGGDYLVSNGIYREVYSAYNPDTEGNEIRIRETDSPLQSPQGALASTLLARDQVFGDYVDRIDAMAASLIRAVNDVHSQGQGRRGHRQLESSVRIDPGAPLGDAGFHWSPRNGSFDMQLTDAEGKVISNHRIAVRMLGRANDSTVHSIVAEINAIEGIEASVGSDGRIQIASSSPTVSFTFGEDTSGFLSAAGINTFFVGRNALDIAVHDDLKRDSDLLAISRGGIGQDTETLTELVDLVDRPIDHLDGRSVREFYENLVVNLGQRVSVQQSETEGLQTFYSTLQSQHLAITGVNIDEESIRMISYQRAFQASSRVIATAVEMLDLLVEL
jgi:flagellar hook-associated protein 1 FlgK